jgi:hypothetical protein
LRELVLAAGTHRGPTYARLVKRHGEGSGRILGSVELRGSNRSLSAYVSFDEEPVPRLFGNVLSLYVERARMEGRPAAEWVEEGFTALCASLSPWWAFACADEEWDARNMDHVGGLRALGREPRRHLPGLFWLSFFGSPYVDLIGRERLLTSPCMASAVDSGVLLATYQQPGDWRAPIGALRHRETLKHLGPQYFFDRLRPDADTTAPPFQDSPPERRGGSH